MRSETASAFPILSPSLAVAPLRNAAAVSATLAGWALLTMDGVQLAVPQKDIVTIGLVMDLQFAQQDGGKEIGWFVQHAERWPVYCLDRHFVLAPMLAKVARVCMLFRSADHTFGLAGTQVLLLANDDDLVVQPLPACLARLGSPLNGLALHRNEIVMSARGSALTDLLIYLESSHGN